MTTLSYCFKDMHIRMLIFSTISTNRDYNY